MFKDLWCCRLIPVTMIPVQTKDNCEVGIFDNKSQQMFSYLFKALLFIHFPLQQQITEAVLKIKVFFFCCLVKKKKKKSAQNSNDSTKWSVNMPHKWGLGGRYITVRKSIMPFSIMKTSQYLYISELCHIIWNYIFIYL